VQGRELEEYKKNEAILVEELLKHKNAQTELCHTFRAREQQLIDKMEETQRQHETELELMQSRLIELEVNIKLKQ
jgi:hypothetical protein